ncbi:MAG: hypothetical protein M3Q56_10860 [Bacteroidota bacterium]|nr:hypothetical protein [Bacteroidota bacterium]
MKLTITANLVNGDLAYNFYEKDKSKGTLTGTMNGDTLFAQYTFMSEGMESVREVAFLKKGNDFVEGYGEMDKETGTKFLDKNNIDFSGNSLLKQTSCN